MSLSIIDFKIYCITYCDILVNVIDEEFKTERFQILSEYLNKLPHGNTTDNLISLLEESSIISDVGLSAQNLNLISPRCIKPVNTITADMIELLATNDLLFVLHNKVWYSTEKVEFQIEIIHDQDMFKYMKEIQ